MRELRTELQSADAFYSFLQVGNGERIFLAKHASYRYSAVPIPKRRGGSRMLLIPDDRLKFLQRKVLELLETAYVPRAPVHGFVSGKGAISNANAHQARPFLLNVDLENFFGSISRNRVRGVLQAIGVSVDTSDAIASLCVTANQLPQGAPTSPILANMICYRLDKQLMTFAAGHRLRYTRYADDLSFSSYVQPAALFDGPVPPAGRIPLDQLSEELRTVILGNGFQINADKIWFSDRKARKEVTGLVVNEFTNVRRTFIRNIRSGLHKVETLGVEFARTSYAAANKDRGTLDQYLKGNLEWLAQVRGRSFSAYRTLASRYNRLFPDTKIPIDPTYDELAAEAVFVIECDEGENTQSQGTAFLLNGVGLVTAFHVVKKLAGRSAVLFRPHKPTLRYAATVGAAHCDHRDLAILDHNIPVHDRVSLSISETPDRTRDPVLALGYPNYGPGDALNQRTGNIVARSTKRGVKMVEVSAILSDGFSGGPVVNSRYQVVGLIHKGGIEEHHQLAVDISEVSKLHSETRP